MDKRQATLPLHAAKLRYIISITGEGLSDPFISEIRSFGFDFTPRWWLRCEGQILRIGENFALFELLDKNFGGDGVQTFAAPDLRRTKVGQDGLRCVAVNYCISKLGMYPPRP